MRIRTAVIAVWALALSLPSFAQAIGTLSAPPRGPEPVTVPTFMIFFDEDSARLNDKAREDISLAANTARSMHVSKITVTGHSDTVGSEANNRPLSLRRAKAVRDQLVKVGLERSNIVVVAKGSDDPVLADNGAPFSKNRRVLVDIWPSR